MKHKLYEGWILDDAPLTDAQQNALDTHLEDCESCRILRRNWIASKQLITLSVFQIPEPGFTDRWHATIIKKSKIEKVRRYRLTIFGLTVLAFISSVIYLLVNGSFMEIFANGFTMISRIILGLTNSLSTLGNWLSRLPIVVPITAGFIFFGLINSFVMTGLFFLWNLKQRKLLPNETLVD